jgi:hypothetical protein
MSTSRIPHAWGAVWTLRTMCSAICLRTAPTGTSLSSGPGAVCLAGAGAGAAGPGGGTGGGWPRGTVRGDDRVNVSALRDLTDDSGGRTEIVRDARDLNPATANIADELSKQYYIGYPSSGKHDGRWHAIRVELRNGNYRVRARRGYVAS